MKNKSSSKLFSVNNVQGFSLAFSIFLFLYPSFLWDSIGFVTPVAFGLLMFSIVIEALIKKNLKISIYLIFFLLYLIYSNTIGIPIYIDYFSTPTIIALLFLFLSPNTIYHSFLIFVKIFGTVLGLSLVVYLLKITGIYSPNLTSQIAPDGRVYQNYSLNAMWEGTINNAFYMSSGFYRFHAFLNEPGFIGTLSSLIIFALRFDFRNNKILYIYLVACLVSMSLASYLVLFVGLIYFISYKKIILISIPVLLLVLFNMELFERFILSRLNMENGNISGDNRTSAAFDKKWESLLGKSTVIIGVGKGQHIVGSVDGGVSSWKSLVYNSGIIGFILYCLIFISIYHSINNNHNKYSILFLLVFLLTIYHRPNIHNIYYLLILIGGLMNNIVLSNKVKLENES